MKEQTNIGMNRTGMHMSPFDSRDLQEGIGSMASIPSGMDSALAELRSEYIAQSDQIGSVPIPGTVKGAITTGVSALSGDNPTLFLDKLGERLAFERTGTRLYDALIVKFDSVEDDSLGMTLEDLQQIREEEAQHFAIVRDAIETLGGDPTSQTPCADVAGVESMGLMQVVTDPRTTLAQSLHAMLIAEMADNSGWETLIALAEANGQSAMVADFTVALDEERRHLQMVKGWLDEATIGGATGQATGAAGASVPPSQLH
jgi:rubrerythrin